MTSPRQLIEKFRTTLRVLRGKRRYPIRRDESGRTARERAYELFSLDLRPKDVCKEVGISIATTRRYYQSWKRAGGKSSQLLYPVVAHYLKKHLEVSNGLIQRLAEFYGTSCEEIISLAQRPWGVMRLLRGGLPNRRRDRIYTRRDAHLYSALKFIRLAELGGTDPELLGEIAGRVADEIQQAGEKRKKTG